MPRQNRVTPSGDIVATPERGTLMGNRGLLHDGEGRIIRPWRERRWIVCLLAFEGRKRQVMSPGLYTELFFLDEATALAAGHRPCAECRRDRFDAFRLAWTAAGLAAAEVKAPEIDGRLHGEWLGPDGTKRTLTSFLTGCSSGWPAVAMSPGCCGRAGCCRGRRAVTGSCYPVLLMSRSPC